MLEGLLCATPLHVPEDSGNTIIDLRTMTSVQGQPQRDPTAAYGSTWTAAGGEEVGYSNGSGGAGHYPTTATWTDAAAGYGYGSLADGQYGQAGYEVANYSQAGYEAATYAQAGYGATPSQEQMGYVPLGYDLAAPASQSWQATPQTAEEAMRIPHGRPPIALISFNIGGRLALFLPQTSVCLFAHNRPLCRHVYVITVCVHSLFSVTSVAFPAYGHVRQVGGYGEGRGSLCKSTGCSWAGVTDQISRLQGMLERPPLPASQCQSKRLREGGREEGMQGYGPGGAGVTRNGPIQLTRLAGLHRLLQHHVADAALLPVRPPFPHHACSFCPPSPPSKACDR